ncbi:MAG: hypothetical protein EP329_09970 [Deltaproteobacteria bacterium]|nr:MAG: hypothetical protein EP329_09970 [Deltaproteobacteria bacterium]
MKHFLSDEERWHELQPRDAARPEPTIERLVAAGARRASLALKDPEEAREDWWKAPFRGALEHAHEHGYKPRYLRLARRAGDPASSASKWRREAQGKLLAEVDGYKVCLGRDHLVLSAYRSYVTPEGSHEPLRENPFANSPVLKRIASSLLDGASRSNTEGAP